MIKKLKTKFIVLAMVSLTVLLSVIVAGMNIINYQKVVSDADRRVEILEQNSSRFQYDPGSLGMGGALSPFDDSFDEDVEEFLFGRDGRKGPSMSRDEAEESRFFTVSIDSSGSVTKVNVTRIASVDAEEAADYAIKALKSGNDKGFADDFRYSVKTENSVTKMTFLDCGRVLDSFRDFLKASILMSLAGLVIVFVVICYFAGRIVRPVAESYEKQKRFITDAGHEIKTPLAIIKANIDLMDMEIDGASDSGAISAPKTAEELKESLGDINDQVDRLTGLTNDLVYLSRMEEDGSTLVMTDVPLSEIVSDSVSSFEPLANDQGKEIKADITEGIAVRGSTKELEKLMSIVLENAVKYAAVPGASDNAAISAGASDEEDLQNASGVITDEGRADTQLMPQIDVSLKKEGKNAVVEIRNATESEMSNESLSHVFERFYRTDSSRNSQTGGHGIGLSMAQAIVAAHGGKISARTTDGRDFIITAALPLA